MQSEALRFERLRAQDGKPLLPPPNMQALTARGGLDPAKVQEARQQWDAAAQEMQARPSYPAEERLFWTAFLLCRHYAEHNARPQTQELAASTLQLLQDPRHRQILLGLAARNAAAMGDVAGAHPYLQQLDPRSEDLQVDTNYRFSTAYVALVQGDAQTALHVLGSQIDDIPINDAYDTVCGVLRAHAHEMTGQVQVAQDQLLRLAGSPQELAMVEDIARSNPALQLVPQSLPVVAERVRQMHQNVVVTKSGIKIGRMIIVPVVGTVVAMAVAGFASSLGSPLNEIVPPVVITLVVVASIAVTFGGVFKGAMVRKRLMKSGVAGTAQLVGVEQTGTRVNDQPLLKLRMLVSVPNKQPYSVLHREVVPMIRLAEVRPGMHLHVRVDPADPAVMCIAW